MRNIRDIGSEFEQYMIEYFGQMGYWVHFFSNAGDGSQPADLIISKNKNTFLIDCKTLANGKTFPVSRIEQNQILAANKWASCGNSPYTYVFVIRCNDNIYFVSYGYINKIRSPRFLLDGHPTSWEDYLHATYCI